MKNKIYLLPLLFMLSINITLSQTTTEWVQRYYQTYNSIDGGNSIITDNNFNVYVTGSDGGPFNYDIVTIKYSATGNQHWISRYNGPANGSDGGDVVILDKDSNLIVVGNSEGIGTGSDYVTIKYSLLGEQQWFARYSSSGNDCPSSVAVDKLGNIFVTGKSSNNYATVKYNSFGIQQWVTLYPAQNLSDFAWAITVDDFSNVYIAGVKGGDYITIKYNSNGIQQWVSVYDGPYNGDDFANSIGLDSSGNVYVSGSIEDELHYGDYTTIKYNNSGKEQWVRRYGGSGNFLDVVFAMKVDRSGNVYVTGYTTESGQGYNMTTIKYSTNGDNVWHSSYNHGLNDITSAICLDNLNNVYITGRSDGNGTGDDYVTVKYDSLGNQKWEMRYDYSGQFGDYPSSLVVDKNGSVFVTGSSDRDFLTIKYSQLTGGETIFSEIPKNYSLLQNYPNPFNPNTIINYQLSMFNFVSLKVYDILGNQVASLVNENKPAGSYEVVFDGSDFPSGIYFYSLSINGNVIDTKRMVLLK
ncbi:MAG: SBBP repeat-containing protein [Ignavibacteria bacterium]|nr:SBBP repeat-containing protein [Ignavibacteria bacterium]